MTVEVVHARVRHAAQLHHLLDAASRDRLAKIHSAPARDRYATGQALARLELAERLGTAPWRIVLDRRCRHCGQAHGKPYVAGADLDFSLSHTGDHVVLAVSSTAAAPVGIDVQCCPTAEPVDPSVAEAVLSPGELLDWTALPEGDRWRMLLRSWTRKEALLKATGHGLAVPPTSIRVWAPGRPPALLSWDETSAGISAPGTGTALVDLNLPGMAGAVALLGRSGLSLSGVQFDRPLDRPYRSPRPAQRMATG